VAQASRLGMAQTMVQPRGSGEISAPARLENAQYSRCNATRYSNSAQYKWRTLHSETLISTKTRILHKAGVSLRGELRYDSWSLSHLGYLCSETTPVVIKLDHNWSCLWV